MSMYFFLSSSGSRLYRGLVGIEPSVKKSMTDSQVRAALGLLGKVLPNVSETKTELTGANGGDLRLITRIETVVIDPANPNG